jgi:NitT/TauT family transport system permease protein
MNSLTKARTPRWESWLWPVFTASVLLAIWFLSVRGAGPRVFPSPLDVERGIAELVRKGLLFRYAGDSLRRVTIGYMTAAACGIPVGLMLGWYPSAAAVMNPVIQMLRPISPIAWIPLAIVWLGVSDAACVLLIFIAAFFPVVVATMNGVRNVPSVFRRAGCNFGLSAPMVIARVIFPAALPQVIVGLRIALGIAWLVVVAAEMIAVDSGLGYLVIDSRNAGQRYDLVVAAMLLIGVIGLILDSGIRRIEKFKSIRWGFQNES